jgi:hypothetical protein
MIHGDTAGSGQEHHPSFSRLLTNENGFKFTKMDIGDSNAKKIIE